MHRHEPSITGPTVSNALAVPAAGLLRGQYCAKAVLHWLGKRQCKQYGHTLMRHIQTALFPFHQMLDSTPHVSSPTRLASSAQEDEESFLPPLMSRHATKAETVQEDFDAQRESVQQ